MVTLTYQLPLRCTDASDPGHFGPKTLRTYQSPDPEHFGMTEVSRHLTLWHWCRSVFRTLWHYTVRVLTSKTNHIAYYAKAYLWVAENNSKFNSSGLYRAALSIDGILSGCSAPCSTASGWVEIIRHAWHQTDYRVTDQLENGGQ